MSVEVHVTAWPKQQTVTVDVTGELDGSSAGAVSNLLSRLRTDLVGTLVVDLRQARLPSAVPGALLATMESGRGVRHALINVPAGVAQPSACTSPRLLWHRRDPDAVPWPEALRLARAAAAGGSCDCGPRDHGVGCRDCSPCRNSAADSASAPVEAVMVDRA